MSGRGPVWTVHVASAAERDFAEAVRWSAERFGPRQARIYVTTLALAVRALASGPEVLGARPRDDIGRGIRVLHVARGGRKGRHFVMFRVASQAERELEMLRLLHDAMDLPRHLPPGC